MIIHNTRDLLSTSLKVTNNSSGVREDETLAVDGPVKQRAVNTDHIKVIVRARKERLKALVFIMTDRKPKIKC